MLFRISNSSNTINTRFSIHFTWYSWILFEAHLLIYEIFNICVNDIKSIHVYQNVCSKYIIDLIASRATQYSWHTNKVIKHVKYLNIEDIVQNNNNNDGKDKQGLEIFFRNFFMAIKFSHHVEANGKRNDKHQAVVMKAKRSDFENGFTRCPLELV